MLHLSTKTNNKLYGLTNGQMDGCCVKLCFLSLLSVFVAQKNRLTVKTLLGTKNVYLKI